jgi:hypothetical protein
MEVLSLRKKCCMLFNESHNVSACVDCQAHVVCRIRSIDAFMPHIRKLALAAFIGCSIL